MTVMFPVDADALAEAFREDPAGFAVFLVALARAVDLTHSQEVAQELANDATADNSEVARYLRDLADEIDP